eukprot:241682-Prymnesium_polylepis.1
MEDQVLAAASHLAWRLVLVPRRHPQPPPQFECPRTRRRLRPESWRRIAAPRAPSTGALHLVRLRVGVLGPAHRGHHVRRAAQPPFRRAARAPRTARRATRRVGSARPPGRRTP